LTSALVAGEWSASRPGLFIPNKEFPLPIGWGAAWATQPIWTSRREEKYCPYWHLNSELSVVQSVANRYTDYANPAPESVQSEVKFACAVKGCKREYRISKQKIKYKLYTRIFAIQDKISTYKQHLG
jgi:hypothetical protein